MAAHQAPPSLGFFRQEHRSGLPFPPPGDLPDPGMEPSFLMSTALADRFYTTSATRVLCSVQNTHVQGHTESGRALALWGQGPGQGREGCWEEESLLRPGCPLCLPLLSREHHQGREARRSPWPLSPRSSDSTYQTPPAPSSAAAPPSLLGAQTPSHKIVSV